MKPPKTEKEIRGFLGRIQYISRFIAQLTTICEPIFKLLKKDVPIKWNEQRQEAFEKIKEYLLKPPILMPSMQGKLLTCWGGSTLLRPSVTLTWCQITCFSHKGLRKSAFVWLGPSFYTYWELTSLPIVGKQCPWGGWPSFRILEMHGGLTRGRHVSPTLIPSLTLSVEAPCGSLWGIGSSFR